MQTQDFINRVAPGAQATMKSRGILASLSIAQAALESGWGVHAPGNNLFGIKAYGWSGATQLLTTKEYIAGKTVTIKDTFRVYGSWEQSIDDHAAFLVKNSRYSNIIGVSDYRAACGRIQQDGYATEKDYAQQLIVLIEQHRLYKYDRLPALIVIDAPAQGKVCTGDIAVSGWAVGIRGILRVDIYADGSQGISSIRTFSERPDVSKVINPFGWYTHAGKSGFSCVIPAGRLSPGKHTINAAAIDVDGKVMWAVRAITVR